MIIKCRDEDAYSSKWVNLDSDLNFCVDWELVELQSIGNLHIELKLVINFVKGTGPGFWQFIGFEWTAVSGSSKEFIVDNKDGFVVSECLEWS